MPTRNGPCQPSGKIAEEHVPHSLQQNRAEHRRQQEQEREARRAVAVELQEAAGGDRDPRPGDAGRERERLRESHRRPLDACRGRPSHAPAASGRPSRAAARRARGGSRSATARRGCRRSTSSPSSPTTPGGNRRDEDEPGDPLVRRVDPAGAAASRARRATSRTMSRPEVRGDRDERSEVERDVEGLVEAVVLLEVRPVGGPGTRMRCPDDEIGRSSVSPWTIPRTSACAVRERVRIVADAGEREDEGKPERRPRDADRRASGARPDPTRTLRRARARRNTAQIAAIR